MSRGRYAFLAALLGLLPMLLPISVDGSLPAMPGIAEYFKTSTASVQYSLSVVVLGIALGHASGLRAPVRGTCRYRRLGGPLCM